MGVRIVSRRILPLHKEKEVMPLILQLRKLAKKQPGFISEESWRHVENPEEYLVVREWNSEDDWSSWHSDQQRAEIQEKIETLLGMKTEFDTFEIIHRIEK